MIRENTSKPDLKLRLTSSQIAGEVNGGGRCRSRMKQMTGTDELEDEGMRRKLKPDVTPRTRIKLGRTGN